MDKSILVIDTPKSCSKCVIVSTDVETLMYRGMYDGCINHTYCPVLKQRVDNFYNIQNPQCPLQPIEDEGDTNG